MHPRFPRLASAATLSMALLAGCAAPLATLPTSSTPGAAPGSPAAPAQAAPAAPQPLAWTTLAGQATFRGAPIANAELRVVDALTDRPAYVVAPGAGASTIADRLNRLAAGRSWAIGVETDALATDAQGRFSVKVAGLEPGKAVRLVVVTGDNALVTLVNGIDARGYRLAAASGLNIDPVTTVMSHLTLGALMTSPALPPQSAAEHIQQAVQEIVAMRPSLERSLPPTSSLPSRVAAETDPTTGTPKKTTQQQSLEQQIAQQLQAIQAAAEKQAEAARKQKEADDAAAMKKGAELNARLTQAFGNGSLDKPGYDRVVQLLVALGQKGTVSLRDVEAISTALEAEIARFKAAPGKSWLNEATAEFEANQAKAEAERARLEARNKELMAAFEKGRVDAEAIMQAFNAQFADMVARLMGATPTGGMDIQRMVDEMRAQFEAEAAKKMDAFFDDIERTGLESLPLTLASKDPELSKLVEKMSPAEIKAFIEADPKYRQMLEEAMNQAVADMEALKSKYVPLRKETPVYQEDGTKQLVADAGLSKAVTEMNTHVVENLLAHSAEMVPSSITAPLPGLTALLTLDRRTLTLVNSANGKQIDVGLNDAGQIQTALSTGLNSVTETLTASRPSHSGGSSSSNTGFTDAVTANPQADTGQALITATTAAEPAVIAQDGDYAWVGLKNPNKLMRMSVNAASLDDVQTWAIDGVPVAVTFHNDQTYVACGNGKLYTVADGAAPELSATIAPGLKGLTSNGTYLLALTTEGQAALLDVSGVVQDVTSETDGFTAIQSVDGQFYATTASGDMKHFGVIGQMPTLNVDPMDMQGGESISRFLMAPFGVIDGDYGHLWTIGASGALTSWFNSDGWDQLTTSADGWAPKALAYTAVDGLPRLFVADGTNKQVRVYFPQADVTPLVEEDPYPVDGAPTELAVDGAGNLWVVTPSTHKIVKLKKILPP